MFKVPERYRYTRTTGEYDYFFATNKDFGCNGVFEIPHSQGYELVAIASDLQGWEHVSCYKCYGSKKMKRAIPSWQDMCLIKDLFWDEQDTVVQFHPPKSEYVNFNNYVLHLWRNPEKEILLPPKEMV